MPNPIFRFQNGDPIARDFQLEGHRAPRRGPVQHLPLLREIEDAEMAGAGEHRVPDLDFESIGNLPLVGLVEKPAALVRADAARGIERPVAQPHDDARDRVGGGIGEFHR